MKFLEIELEDIFAYEGVSRINLGDTTEEKPIVLIWGRNGMGKTSFLNAIKLLFLGVGDQKLRKVGFPPIILPERQFVVGDHGGWSGVINKEAARKAARDGGFATARVKASWLDDQGNKIIAQRLLRETVGAYEEILTVSDSSNEFNGEPAQERLEDFMPREFVDFFFFDGEDIKSLAETAEHKQINFDRLLRIEFVSTLSDELSRVAIERERRSINSAALERIGYAEAEIVRARRAQEAAQQQLAEIEDELASKLADMRKLQVMRENLSGGASEATRASYESRRKELRTALEENAGEILEQIPPRAPMIVNLGLTKLALEAVDSRLRSAGGTERLLVSRIKEQLPTWLSELPIKLPSEDIPTLSSALGDRIDGIVTPSEASGIFASLDVGRAQRLQNSLQKWVASGTEVRQVHAASLLTARRLQHELNQVNDALMQIEVGSQTNLEKYRDTISKIADLEEKISDLQQRKGSVSNRISDEKQKEEKNKIDLKNFEKNMQQATQDKKDATFMRNVMKSLNEYKETLRQSMRIEIQKILNEKFSMLVHEHSLVQKINIDEAYTMMFWDEQDNIVGRASLSSGLKQLAATALLWAMKETAGGNMPVLIDTPLGRIDRENQDRMLHEYYPKISHQIIVLPTNAEIDARKLEIIKPYITREYTIINKTGKNADIVLGNELVH